MSLRLKFNLSVLVVLLFGLAMTSYQLNKLLHKNARDEVLHEAGLLMESALAIRGYTVNHVRPRLQSQLAEEFLPQTVPAFAATETLSALQKKYPQYSYKEATLNPTNLRNKADPWEAKIVEAFRSDPGMAELNGVRSARYGTSSLYVARPIKVNNAACLACHSTSAAAPASLVRAYGKDHGFGWQMDEIVGAQIVQVPMAVPIERARLTLHTSIAALVAIFVALFIILNVMLNRLVIRPIKQMGSVADAISVGDFAVRELNVSGTDEVARLAQSFNRMTTSLATAMQLIGAKK